MDKIEYFSTNTTHIFGGDPTDEEVREYGKELGELLTLISGSGAALKLVSKVAPKLAKKLDKDGMLNKGTGEVDDFAKEPFLPDEAYEKNLPKFVEPGTKSLNKYDEFGNLKQSKYYDDYGREKGWVDFTNHGYPSNQSVPHWHEVQWNDRYPIGGYKIDHRMDTNIPFK